MVAKLEPPLTPRNGRLLRILVPCRISDPAKQDERSLPAQRAKAEKWLGEHTDFAYELTVLEGRESGEWIEREDYLALIDLVESDAFDLVLSEDLGRIVRRLHAHLFAETCVDHETRLISINDYVDTSVPGWQDRSIFAAWHHERSNRDTSDRLKRTGRYHFNQGGWLTLPILGYVKPPGAKSDADVRKDPEAEPIYKEWFRRLDEGATYSEIADWLAEASVPLGPYCRSERWTGPIVARITHNTILKGVRFRNRRMSRRDSKGKYRTVKAPPSEHLERKVPRLAFFEEAYYDRVVGKADARNLKFRRKGSDGVDTRRNVPKKRTRWPGQHVYCGVCGRLFGWGGNGAKDTLMCVGAKAHRCWLGTAFHGPTAAERIATAVFCEIETLPDFDEAFLDAINAEAKRVDGVRVERLAVLAAQAQKLEREISHVMAFIREGDISPRVRDDLARLEQQLAAVQADKEQTEQLPSDVLVIPPSAEITAVAKEAITALANDSPEFGKVMRAIIPKVVVFPYRLSVGERVVLRAKFRVQVSNLLSDKRVQQVLQQPLERVLTVDLFDPPQPEAFRRRICELRAGGMTQREGAEQCQLTVTAAQDAAGLQRRMDALGLTDPYIAVTEPPEDYGKFRRHLHGRYRFEPLESAGEV